MHLLNYFPELSSHPVNAQKLKGLILQLAVQGRLTADWRQANPKVEPASELLKRIAAEKAELIKAKKIKKEKPLPAIIAEEILYQLPEGWEWCRMVDICYKITDGFHNSPPKVKQGIPYILSTHVKSDNIDWDHCFYVEEKYHLELYNKSYPQKGEILLVNIGAGCGTPAIIDVDYEFSFKNSAILKQASCISSKYLFLFLLNIKSFILNDITQGGAQPYLSLKMIKNIIFPLPPLPEQKAIVTIVEQLFQEAEQLEALTAKRVTVQQKLAQAALHQMLHQDLAKGWQMVSQNFGELFKTKASVQQLRESILQLAVQGKLTTQWRQQNPDAESARELLKRIAAEKTELIKAKKIKKEKPLSAITAEEIPYGLPEGWEWCRFSEIVINRDGERIPVSREDRVKRQGKYDYYGASGVIDKIDDFLFDKDLLLIGEDGANLINRSTPIAFFARGKYWVNNHAHVIDATHFIILEYLRVFINSISLEAYVTGTAQPKLSQKKMNLIKTPLPPLPEQKAIVAQVDRLMVLCDVLEGSIGKREQTLEDWMASVLVEVGKG
ncbi:hypothetical protein BKI52_04365 [marine bacterium AO1-C]|nr:hypothetical protein BKI52_04365 [marine bacterium AO1-C]